MERYTLNFGRSNAGATASFTTFARLDTLAALTQPTIHEISDGWFYFEYDASLAPAGVTQIVYTAICGTGEESDVFTVAAAAGAAGTTTATGTGVAAAAPVPYELFFGTSLAGNAPAFVRFARADTHAAITAPAITEIGNGLYQFIIDWRSQPATSIEYVASCGGVELAGVLDGSPPTGSIAVAAGTVNYTGYATAQTVINRTAIQCGNSTAVDVYASTDPDMILMRELLISLGDDLLAAADWTHFVRLASFVTDGSTTTYQMPADYHEMVEGTMWNRSTFMKGMGPLTFQQSAALQARLLSVVISITYQVQGNTLVCPLVPPAGATASFHYVSSYWVKSAAGTTPDKSRPTASDDVLLLDEDLLVLGLKAKFLEARGFDTAVAQARYEEKLEHCIGKNKGGGQTLALSGPKAVAGWAIVIPEGNWSA